MLEDFVSEASTFYGETFTCVNVHGLIHACDDIERFNCNLTELSAFDFESYLYTIKQDLRSPSKVLAQFCKRMHEKDLCNNKKIEPKPEIEILSENLVTKEIKRLTYKECTFTSSHPDNTAMLINGEIVKVVKMQKKYNTAIIMHVKK